MSENNYFKIRILDETHDRLVQKALIEAGHQKWYDGKDYYQPAGGTHSLYTYTYGASMSYMPNDAPGTRRSEAYFLNSPRSEFFLHSDGKFYPTKEDLVKRGPLGLKPRFIHDGERLKEMLRAMTDFAAADKAIPEDWMVELFTVSKGAQTKVA